MPTRGARGGRNAPRSAASGRAAVEHHALVLVRGEAEHLDLLLERARVRKLLVRRLGPSEVLLNRAAIGELMSADLPVAVAFEQEREAREVTP